MERAAPYLLLLKYKYLDRVKLRSDLDEPTWRNYSVWQILQQTWIKANQDLVFNKAAAISYFTVFSLPPILFIITSISGFFFSKENVQAFVFEEIGALIGSQGAQQLFTMMDSFGMFQGSIWRTVFGFLFLIFTSTTLFATIQRSLNVIFRVKPKPRIGVVKIVIDRLFSFLLVLSLAFVLLISLGLYAATGFVESYAVEHFPNFSIQAYNAAAIFYSQLILFLIIAMMYKYLPDAYVSWRSSGLGALLASALFSFGKYLIGLYVGQSEFVTLYGATGSLIVILLWVYYASIIFLFGAVFTYVYARVRGYRLQPSDYAVKIVRQEIIVERGKDTED